MMPTPPPNQLVPTSDNALSDKHWVKDKIAISLGLTLGVASAGVLFFKVGLFFITCFMALLGGYYIVKGLRVRPHYARLSSGVMQLLAISFLGFLVLALSVPKPIGSTILGIGLHFTVLLISIRLMLALKNNASPAQLDTPKPVALTPSPDNVPQPTEPLQPVLLSVEKDAHYLNALVAPATQVLLAKLISTINQLSHSQTYLRSHHAYLANAVQLLIEDLTVNTINRLNSLAQPFVQNGNVDAQAQSVFLERYNQNITDLLQKNLEQLQALNQSILEKQMSEFERIGNPTEQAFRNSLMEIKILIRQLMASHHDKTSTDGYQILLTKIEQITLVEMTKIFFDNSTTQLQQQELYQQLLDLIEYLKHSNTALTATSPPVNDILQLSSVMPPQEGTQKFIDWNHQYIQQLKQHW